MFHFYVRLNSNHRRSLKSRCLYRRTRKKSLERVRARSPSNAWTRSRARAKEVQCRRPRRSRHPQLRQPKHGRSPSQFWSTCWLPCSKNFRQSRRPMFSRLVKKQFGHQTSRSIVLSRKSRFESLRGTGDLRRQRRSEVNLRTPPISISDIKGHTIITGRKSRTATLQVGAKAKIRRPGKRFNEWYSLIF